MQADQRGVEFEICRKSMRAVGHPSLGAAVFQDRKKETLNSRASKNRVWKFDIDDPRRGLHETQRSGQGPRLEEEF